MGLSHSSELVELDPLGMLYPPPLEAPRPSSPIPIPGAAARAPSPHLACHCGSGCSSSNCAGCGGLAEGWLDSASAASSCRYCCSSSSSSPSSSSDEEEPDSAAGPAAADNSKTKTNDNNNSINKHSASGDGSRRRRRRRRRRRDLHGQAYHAHQQQQQQQQRQRHSPPLAAAAQTQNNPSSSPSSSHLGPDHRPAHFSVLALSAASLATQPTPPTPVAFMHHPGCMCHHDDLHDHHASALPLQLQLSSPNSGSLQPTLLPPALQPASRPQTALPYGHRHRHGPRALRHLRATELWEHIFSFLPLHSLTSAAQTCRRLSRIRWLIIDASHCQAAPPSALLASRSSREIPGLRSTTPSSPHTPAARPTPPTVLTPAALHYLLSKSPQILLLPPVALAAGPVLVARSVSQCTTLRHLTIRGAHLPAEAAASLRTLLPLLLSLDLSCNSLEDDGLELLAQTAPAHHLHNLDLSDNGLTAAALPHLRRLLQQTPRLRALSLAENTLGSGAGPGLATVLGDSHPALRRLSLESTALGNAGLPPLVAALAARTCGLAELLLTDCAITDEGAAHLAALVKGARSLRHLALDHNDLCPRGAADVLAALPASSLESINLWDNRIGDDGARALATALQQPSTRLASVTLRFNHFTHIAGVALANALQLSSTLTYLDLSHGQIQDVGASALGAALEHNSSLQSLLLAGNAIGADGLRCLAEGVANNSTLAHLDLSGNAIDNRAATAFARALERNTALRRLNLAASSAAPHITEAGARSLARMLLQNTTLAELNLKKSIDLMSAAPLATAVADNSACIITILHSPCGQLIALPRRSWWQALVRS